MNDASIMVQPLPEGAAKIVQRGGYYGRYVASGHLVYIHDDTLFAAPFDLEKLEVTRSPVPALQGVSVSSSNGSAQFAMSSSGTLVYLAGKSTANGVPIFWMGADGKTTPLRSMSSDWSNPQFSPDGRKLAIDIFDGSQTNIFVYEWDRDTLTRLTFDKTSDIKPVWSPDGHRIVFTSSSRGNNPTSNLYWMRADGSGQIQRLTESNNTQIPGSWHPSGKYFAFQENSESSSDILILPMEGDEASGWKPGKPTVFMKTPESEQQPVFSPDGRWIAYNTGPGGQQGVFVRPFPAADSKWQVSSGGGGLHPTWSRTRRELFYVGLDNRIMVVTYSTEGDSFKPDKPRPWSDRTILFRPRIRPFDLHPDGNRFAVSVDAEPQTPQNNVVFIFNFFDELRRIAPISK